MTRIGVVTFPGTLDDRDAARAVQIAGAEAVALWHKVTTVEDPEWTRRYHSLDLAEKAFGGAVEITLKDGAVITDEIAVADAHPLGARPFAREQYLTKLRSLAEGVVAESELERFIQAAGELPSLEAGDLGALNILASVDLATGPEGIF